MIVSPSQGINCITPAEFSYLASTIFSILYCAPSHHQMELVMTEDKSTTNPIYSPGSTSSLLFARPVLLLVTATSQSFSQYFAYFPYKVYEQLSESLFVAGKSQGNNGPNHSDLCSPPRETLGPLNIIAFFVLHYSKRLANNVVLDNKCICFMSCRCSHQTRRDASCSQDMVSVAQHSISLLGPSRSQEIALNSTILAIKPGLKCSTYKLQQTQCLFLTPNGTAHSSSIRSPEIVFVAECAN